MAVDTYADDPDGDTVMTDSSEAPIEEPRPDAAPPRRRLRIISASLAVVVVAAVVGVVVTVAVRHHHALPAGYKWETYTKVTFAVPAAWLSTNIDPDTNCDVPEPVPQYVVIPIPGGVNMNPSLVGCPRHVYLSEVARIGPTDVTPAFGMMPYEANLVHHIRIDGVEALRGDGEVGMGGPGVYEGFVLLPSLRISMYVRTDTQATMTAILDSVYLT